MGSAEREKEEWEGRYGGKEKLLGGGWSGDEEVFQEVREAKAAGQEGVGG